MKRLGWCVPSVVLIGFCVAGCGLTTSSATPSHSPTASIVSSNGHREISVKPRAGVQITVQQGPRELAVQVTTSHKISPTAARQLQAAVQQLNQLLQKLQNP